MNNSFLIQDKYREFTPAINKVINDFDSKGELIKGSRNTIKKINIENLVINIKRFKSPNIFDKIKKYSDDFENGRKCTKRLKKFFRL